MRLKEQLELQSDIEVPLTSLELAELYQVVLKKYQEQEATKSKAILEEL